MEKLPMGRRRASLIKKWKKRYFRAKAGNLFYYEVRGYCNPQGHFFGNRNMLKSKLLL